ncbi:MAG TPA: hypothetical protein P5275_17650 [Saprospiraceae bacterium]|nr:hypothetical protein [Saprospiraceae bacterium]MCB9269824.1 hypothetical protein [Lewinellaceae bacterium]HPG08961.1 hypothetical protein [Saprospiraceae bacterium]HPQ99352.1 hypothetical protein [Saprospiraceae bacterium]HQU51985.1 hypothetical protein [Saprospiraceae bacterium]
MKKRLLLPGIIISLILLQCSKSEDPTPDECSGVTATYNNGIQSIINSSCALAGCHTGDVPQPKYDSYAAVKALVSSIQSRVSDKSMPPAGATPLSDAQIKLITCWVQNGAPEN